MSDVERVIKVGELFEKYPTVEAFVIGFLCGVLFAILVYSVSFFLGYICNKNDDTKERLQKLNAFIRESKTDVAREIFDEIEFDIHQLDFDQEKTRAIAIEGVIANLKKKYTEEKKDEKN